MYIVILTFDSENEILNCVHAIELKATEQYFPVVMFMKFYKVVTSFDYMDKILARKKVIFPNVPLGFNCL